MTVKRTLLVLGASLIIASGNTSPAMALLYEPVYVAQIVSLLAGGIYHVDRPPMTELESFVYWENPADTDQWVHWQQKGRFRGAEGSTKIGRGLILFRNDLRTALVERTGRMSASDFEARYGTDQAPNFCAISKEAIAATFAVRYGRKADDSTVSKHSRCTA